ncbi:zf-CCHC_4 domain-containing protein, partial [Cephalotus follicularis]
FLKLRVGIVVCEPLCRGVNFKIGNADKIWLSLQYEKLPNFCHCCGRIGHTNKECSYLKQNEGERREVGVRYGPWLRVDNFRGEASTPEGKIMKTMSLHGIVATHNLRKGCKFLFGED